MRARIAGCSRGCRRVRLTVCQYNRENSRKRLLIAFQNTTFHGRLAGRVERHRGGYHLARTAGKAAVLDLSAAVDIADMSTRS
jgi:hypothetical protein